MRAQVDPQGSQSSQGASSSTPSSDSSHVHPDSLQGRLMRAQSPAVTVQSTSTVPISSTSSERPAARSISSTSTRVVRAPPATVPSSLVSLATTSVANQDDTLKLKLDAKGRKSGDFASCYVKSKENDIMFKREEMTKNMRIADARLKLESSRFQSDRDVKAEEIRIKQQEIQVQREAMQEITERDIIQSLISANKTAAEIKEFLDTLNL